MLSFFFQTCSKILTGNPNYTRLIMAEFQKMALDSYSDHMYDWKQKWVKGKDKPKGLDADIWTGLKRYWLFRRRKPFHRQTPRTISKILVVLTAPEQRASKLAK